MPVHDLPAHVQELCEAFPLLRAHVLQMYLLARLLVLDDVGARMLLGTVPHGLAEPLSIKACDRLRERQLPRHEYWYSDLVCGDVGVRRNDTSSSVVDSLTHHFHSEHAFLLLEQLSDSALLLVCVFRGHRRVHKAIYSLLELNPFLRRNS